MPDGDLKIQFYVNLTDSHAERERKREREGEREEERGEQERERDVGNEKTGCICSLVKRWERDLQIYDTPTAGQCRESLSVPGK